MYIYNIIYTIHYIILYVCIYIYTFSICKHDQIVRSVHSLVLTLKPECPRIGQIWGLKAIRFPAGGSPDHWWFHHPQLGVCQPGTDFLEGNYSSTVPDLMCRSSRCSEMEIRWRFFQRAKIPVKRRTGRWKFFKAVGRGQEITRNLMLQKIIFEYVWMAISYRGCFGCPVWDSQVDWIHQTRR